MAVIVTPLDGPGLFLLLLKILKTNFPAWVNNKTSLKLLKQELIHLPPEMVSGELRKQIADIQEELP